jgi:Protein of unknown function (DUF5131)
VSTATAIEWTETTWNPTTGCDRISPGCDHCYALTLAARLKAMGQAKYQLRLTARSRQSHPRPGSSPPGGLAHFLLDDLELDDLELDLHPTVLASLR